MRPFRLERGASGWPTVLDTIDAPPTALWLRGDATWLARRPAVAIVGTRSPSAYGTAQAQRFAWALARAGVVIISGLARGIDAAAHEAALDAGGGTIAVLGCGVDRPWPAGPLTSRVTCEGLLVAEYPPGTSPRRHHFPRRNRLISGLSDLVLVVEAAWASGSLITARWAADQGRGVHALPGRVDHPLSRGTHRLLREGAQLVEEPCELLDELGLAAASSDESGNGSQRLDALSQIALADPGGGGLPAEIHAALEGETLSADELAERTGGDVGDVLTSLVLLELQRLVTRGPGGLYRRARGNPSSGADPRERGP